MTWENCTPGEIVRDLSRVWQRLSNQVPLTLDDLEAVRRVTHGSLTTQEFLRLLDPEQTSEGDFLDEIDRIRESLVVPRPAPARVGAGTVFVAPVDSSDWQEVGVTDSFEFGGLTFAAVEDGFWDRVRSFGPDATGMGSQDYDQDDLVDRIDFVLDQYREERG